MSVAVRFQSVSKQYRLGEIGTGTISNDLHRTWAKLLRKPDPFAQIGVISDHEVSSATSQARTSRQTEYVWALKDISFDVQQGEIIGIIGRNGAGKSTLLKLLSRVTAPSSGCIKVKGRIASLLEVGTGFHPELTGRENIYLNGAILGMQYREISKQLESIVEFSGCSQHIDTPVKRYSSGMMVRLGFAVAAHLQCEILIVDEVLAVGDAEFQRRCIGRMREVAGEGRTVIFVSHAMATVTSLCESAILLERGHHTLSGSPQDVVSTYLRSQQRSSTGELSARENRQGNGRVRVRKIQFLSFSYEGVSAVQCGASFIVRVFFATSESGLRITLAIGIDNEHGSRISHLNTACVCGESLLTDSEDNGSIDFRIEHNPLVPGSYMLTTFLTADGEIADWVEQAAELVVVEGDFFGTGKLPPKNQGCVLIEHSISTSNIKRVG